MSGPLKPLPAPNPKAPGLQILGGYDEPEVKEPSIVKQELQEFTEAEKATPQEHLLRTIPSVLEKGWPPSTPDVPLGRYSVNVYDQSGMSLLSTELTLDWYFDDRLKG